MRPIGVPRSGVNRIACSDNPSTPAETRTRPRCETNHRAAVAARLCRPRKSALPSRPRSAALGSSSTPDWLITLSTSLVAVWYSSDSCRSCVRPCRSPRSRAFSIAITAWSAKVVTSAICFSVNGSTRDRKNPKTPISVSSRSNGTPRPVCRFPRCCASVQVYSGSFAASSMCTTRRSSKVRPLNVPRSTPNGFRCMKSLNSAAKPNEAARWWRPSRSLKT